MNSNEAAAIFLWDNSLNEFLIVVFSLNEYLTNHTLRGIDTKTSFDWRTPWHWLRCHNKIQVSTMTIDAVAELQLIRSQSYITGVYEKSRKASIYRALWCKPAGTGCVRTTLYIPSGGLSDIHLEKIPPSNIHLVNYLYFFYGSTWVLSVFAYYKVYFCNICYMFNG